MTLLKIDYGCDASRNNFIKSTMSEIVKFYNLTIEQIADLAKSTDFEESVIAFTEFLEDSQEDEEDKKQE